MKKYKIIIALLIFAMSVDFLQVIALAQYTYPDFPDTTQFKDSQYIIYKNEETGNIELSQVSAEDIDVRLIMAETKEQVEVISEKEVAPGFSYSPKFGTGTGEDISPIDNTKIYLSESGVSAYIVKWILQDNHWVPLSALTQESVICENYSELYFSTLPVAEIVYKAKTARPYYRAYSGEYYVLYDTSKTYINELCEYKYYILFSKDGIKIDKKVEIPIFDNMGISGAYSGNDVTLVFGMPEYTLHGTGHGSVYVFDKNCNLIGTKNYQGYVRCNGFYDGYFYFEEETNLNNTLKTMYKKTTDGINDIEISEDEYNIVVAHIEAQQHSTVSQNKITFDSNTNPLKVSIVDKNGLQSDVLYESEHLIRPNENSIYSRELGKIVRSPWMVNEFTNLVTDYISIDCVYKIPIPALDSSKTSFDIERCIWMTDEYIYIDQDIEYILRLPIQQRLNVPYIRLNGNILGFSQPPIIEEGRTLVPMRFLFEQMGADVDWNAETQTATATLNNTAVTFAIDDTEATVNNQPTTMEVPAQLVNGKTMVPLRFLSEELGYTVTWDEETRTAIIE